MKVSCQICSSDCLQEGPSLEDIQDEFPIYKYNCHHADGVSYSKSFDARSNGFTSERFDSSKYYFTYSITTGGCEIYCKTKTGDIPVSPVYEHSYVTGDSFDVGPKLLLSDDQIDNFLLTQ